MVQQKGPWKVTKSRKVYESKWATLQEDAVISRTGKKSQYPRILMRDGVSVVPVDAKGNVYLAKEYRHALGSVRLETVSGGIERGQTPLVAAKRELKEEAGITAKKWTYFGRYDTLSSKLTHGEHIYLAEDLSFGPQELEENEEIEIVKMTLAKAVKLALANTITSSHSVHALLRAERALSGKRKK